MVMMFTASCRLRNSKDNISHLMKKSFTHPRLYTDRLLRKWLLMVLAIPFFSITSLVAQLQYVAVACNDPYVQAFGQPGTVFIGAGDDATFTNLNLPFPFTFYGVAYTQFLVNNNGNMKFLPGAAGGFTNTPLPTATAGAGLYPFWDDLWSGATIPNSGMYSRVDGVAPNRTFTVEWYNVG